MFSAETIKRFTNAQPFKPFRICMSDGKAYDVMNHDSALVTRQYVEVGVDIDARGIAENIDRLAIIHINRIMDVLPGAKKAHKQPK